MQFKHYAPLKASETQTESVATTHRRQSRPNSKQFSTMPPSKPAKREQERRYRAPGATRTPTEGAADVNNKQFITMPPQKIC